MESTHPSRFRKINQARLNTFTCNSRKYNCNDNQDCKINLCILKYINVNVDMIFDYYQDIYNTGRRLNTRTSEGI